MISHPRPLATRSKSPQHWGDLGGPYLLASWRFNWAPYGVVRTTETDSRPSKLT